MQPIMTTSKQRELSGFRGLVTRVDGRFAQFADSLKLYQVMIAFLIFPLAALVVWVGYNWHVNEELRRVALHLHIWEDCDYAVQLRMRAVSDPEINEWMAYPDFKEHPDEYKRVEFVMEFPPEEQRERGVIYFMPAEGRYEERVLRLNCILSVRPELLEGTGLSMPLTVEDVVLRAEDVRELIGSFEPYERVYFRDGDTKGYYYPSAGWADAIAQARASLSPADAAVGPEAGGAAAADAEAGGAGSAADAAG